MPENTFDEIMNKYVKYAKMNVPHPFMESNIRSTRIWLDLMPKCPLKRYMDWSQIGKKDYLNAIRARVADSIIWYSLCSLQRLMTEKWLIRMFILLRTIMNDYKIRHNSFNGTKSFHNALIKPQAIHYFYSNEELVAKTKEFIDSLRKNRTIDYSCRHTQND